MSEASLWAWLRERLPEGRYSRIESETSPGFPDVDYTISGISGTIELKKSRSPTSNLPFRRGGLRDTQLRWIEDEIEQGGRVFIIAQMGEWIHLFNASDVYENFNSMTMIELHKAALVNLRLRGSPDGLKEKFKGILTAPNG